MTCRVLLAGPRGSFEAWKFNVQNAVFELLRAPRGVKIGPRGLLEPSWSILASCKHLEAFWGAIVAPILAPFLEPNRQRAVPNFFFSAPEASKNAPRASLEAF